ncbi:hypothetical protein ERJ75_001398200 [Trypanosoma vivax]|nr:hypothetical protein ERJ75_001398200 [Trypanosoma vivax]
MSAMLACGLALALWSLPALANNGQGKALSEDKVQVVCKLSALLKRMSLEAEKLGSVATLATGFEASEAEEDMDVMREALGSAARLLRQRAAREEGPRNETKARELAKRIVRLHEAEQRKALAAQLSENVRQRTALTAAAIDGWIKTFAANYQDANAACIVAQGGKGKGKKQSLRFSKEDEHAEGCAVSAAELKAEMLEGKKLPATDIEWKRAVETAADSESEMLVGSETDTKFTLTAGTAGNYAGAAADATHTWGVFWQLTGHSASSSVSLKWSDAHQDLGTNETKSKDALNEMWLHFKQLKETDREILNACNGQQAERTKEATRTQATLRRPKQEHAPRHSEAGHGGRRQQRGAEGTARRSHRARSEDTGKRKHAKGRSRGRRSNATDKQGGHRGPAPQTRTAASESAAHARSCRQQARGAAASLVAFLAGSKNRQHADV